MGSKRGFTLIELLAVIVILAVIALISTPIIIGVIDKARKGAFEDSIYGILDAGKVYYVDKLADTNRFNGKIFTFQDDISDLKLSGNKPYGGTLSLDKDGKQSILAYDKDKKWCAEKKYDNDKVTIKNYQNSNCDTMFADILVGTVRDVSGKNHDGVIYGDSTVADDGITFHGEGFVDAGYAGYNFKDGITMIIRGRLNEYVSQHQVLIGNLESSGGAIYVFSDQKLYTGLWIESVSNYRYIYDGPIIDLKQLHTYVMTYDKNKFSLYMDGVLVGSIEDTKDLKVSPVPFNIGTNPQIDGAWFESSKATVTDALVLDRGITEAEVKTYFSSTIKTFSDSHVLFQYKWA